MPRSRRLDRGAGSVGAEDGGAGDEQRGARRPRSGPAVSASIPPSTSIATLRPRRVERLTQAGITLSMLPSL